MTAIVTVQQLRKRFGPRQILDGVNFAVHAADRIALVGVNGTGKSTLLRYLADDGELRDAGPDEGLITRARGLTVEYVAQEPVLTLDASVDANLREGLRAHRAAEAAIEQLETEMATLTGAALDQAVEAHAMWHQQVADLGGFDVEYELRGLSAALALPPMGQIVGELSMGERRRVALARALLARPALLALDEPTNHLDAATVAWLEARLLERKGALLLVTHDRYFLDRVATRILELDRGQVHDHPGGYVGFLERQASRWSHEAEHERRRASYVRREIDWIRRGPQARTTKQQARIDRFDNAVADGEARLDRAGPAELRLAPGPRLGNTIVVLDKLTQRLGERTLFENLELRWKPGDRIGVVGVNGAGKSTLVRTILGQLAPTSGKVTIGSNTRIATMEQQRTALDDDATVIEEITEGGETVELASGPVHPRTFLRMMLFDDAMADAKIGVLSGGERNRVQLAKLLLAGANFLILDEPTNDLDTLTLAVLEDALANFPGCALIVSHDRWFLDKVATGILAFEGNGVVTFFEGNCTDYLAKAGAKNAMIATGGPTKASSRERTATTPPPAVTGPRRRTFKEQREFDGMEAVIETLDGEVTRLAATLELPETYVGESASGVAAIVARLATARRELEAAYARWQALEALTPYN